MLPSYLRQPSTYRGIIGLCVSMGLFELSPEAQDQVVTVALQLLAAGHALTGLINVLRDEHKTPTPPKGPRP